MKTTVLIGYNEDAEVVAEIDQEVKKCPGTQRSDWLRAAVREKLWGPGWTFVEVRRSLEQSFQVFSQTVESMKQGSEKLLAKEATEK